MESSELWRRLFNDNPKTEPNKRLKKLIAALEAKMDSPEFRAWTNRDRREWAQAQVKAITEDHYVRSQEAKAQHEQRLEAWKAKYLSEFEGTPQQRSDEREQIALDLAAMTDDEVINYAMDYTKAKDGEHIRPNELKAVKARLVTLPEATKKRMGGSNYLADFTAAMEAKQYDEPWRKYGEGVAIVDDISYHAASMGKVRFGLGEYGKNEQGEADILELLEVGQEDPSVGITANDNEVS